MVSGICFDFDGLPSAQPSQPPLRDQWQDLVEHSKSDGYLRAVASVAD
jgi:hypothetical protein